MIDSNIKSIFLSNENLNIEITYRNDSILINKLLEVIKSSYCYDLSINPKAELKLKINLIDELEFKKLSPKFHRLKLTTKDTMLWNEETDHSYFLEKESHFEIDKYLNFPISLTALKNNYAIFHSSCCYYDNKIIFFIGPSKSGKSSLSYFLHKSGLNIIGDDLIYLKNENSTYKIFCNPRFVKFRSKYLINKFDLDQDKNAKLNTFIAKNPLIILVFPNFQQNSKNIFDYTKINKTDALTLMLDNNMRIGTSDKELSIKHNKILFNFISKITNESFGCFRLNYSEQIFNSENKFKESIQELFINVD